MSETTPFDSVGDSVADGADAIRDNLDALLQDDLQPFAEEVTRLFDTLGESIADSLSDAAEKGRFSVSGLVDNALADLSRLAAERLVKDPLERAFGSIFGGARADGGPVLPGAAYLVGERGPEVFVPSQSGRVAPSAPSTINVSVALQGPSGGAAASSAGIDRSGAQIAAAVQRGLSRALRNA